MKIDLPETLPLHISTRGSHTYETAMENREGSHAAMTKAWAVMRQLIIDDARMRERMAALGWGQPEATLVAQTVTPLYAGATIKKRGTRS